MSDDYRHVYLSPHYDDAALSCGGMIHQQTQAGQLVLVLTIFAAPPPANEPLSPFAELQHQQWGNPKNVIAARQAEDQVAMHILGADYLRLKFTDCIYRGKPQEGNWYYTGEADLFGKIHPADRLLVAEIVEAVLELVPAGDETVIYAPLTVGHHVDHQLVNVAACQLRHQGCALIFYEDYPYVDPYISSNYPYSEPATIAARQAAPVQARLRPISEENLLAKINSIGAYASQIPVLFGSGAEMTACVRRYARHLGQKQLAERIWV